MDNGGLTEEALVALFQPHAQRVETTAGEESLETNNEAQVPCQPRNNGIKSELSNWTCLSRSKKGIVTQIFWRHSEETLFLP